MTVVLAPVELVNGRGTEDEQGRLIGTIIEVRRKGV